MTVTALNINSRQPSAEIVTITPALAKEWLGLNINNRPKKSQKSAMYGRDMKDGHWLFTGEAIKFDWNNNLIDGQNRLFACIESNTPITVLVVRGLDPEVQVVLDSGAPRTARDSLNMKGFERAGDLAATVLVHSLWKNGTFKNCMTQTPGYARPTNYEVVEYVMDHTSLIDAVKVVKPVQRRMPMAIGAIATAYDELAKIDTDAAFDFFERIREDRTDGRGDPVRTLIDKAQDMRINRDRRWPSTSLYLIFRAWNAHRAGKTLSHFTFGNEAKGWTAIPEPK